MPRSAPYPCSSPGCPHTTPNGGRCDTCRARLGTTARSSTWAADRGTDHARQYGRRWRLLRAMILARDPVCTLCGTAAATEVDHITPRHQGGDDSEDNLRGVCGPCHARKTGQEGQAARRRRGNPPTRGVGNPPTKGEGGS